MTLRLKFLTIELITIELDNPVVPEGKTTVLEQGIGRMSTWWVSKGMKK